MENIQAAAKRLDDLEVEYKLEQNNMEMAIDRELKRLYKENNYVEYKKLMEKLPQYIDYLSDDYIKYLSVLERIEKDRGVKPKKTFIKKHKQYLYLTLSKI